MRELSFAAHLGEFNEWWWFFPTLNSPFNTRAIVYNYKEGWWDAVPPVALGGASPRSYTAHPIFADDFVAFQHTRWGAPIRQRKHAPVVLPFAESFDLSHDGPAPDHGQAAHP